MKFSTQIKPISYLKSHTAEIVKQISSDHEPIIITQNGEAKMVVMDINSYEQYQETFALLKLLALGEAQIKTGKFRDADQVFSDLDED